MEDPVEKFSRFKEAVTKANNEVTRIGASLQTLQAEEQELLATLKTHYGINSIEELEKTLQRLFEEINTISQEAEGLLNDVNVKVGEGAQS